MEHTIFRLILSTEMGIYMEDRIKRKVKNNISGYLFLAPSLIGFTVFILYPILSGFALSFTNSDGFNPPQWIGVANYIELFQSEVIRKSLLNNVVYTLIYVPGSVILSLIVAVLVHDIGKGSGFFKTVLFFPNITSFIAIAIIWKQLFLPDKGLINEIFHMLGVANTPMWLTSTKTALLSVTIVAIWKAFGFNMILFLSGLQSIPGELYEVGMLDGCRGWKRFRYITFPLLSPTVFFVLIMGIIDSFKVFDLVFQMTEGGPGNATTVMVYQIYKEGIQHMRMGYASALSYVLFFIVVIITFVQFYCQKKWVYYGGE